MKRLLDKATYANVVSTLCLCLLVGGGTAFAAVELEKESVGTKELKKEAVSLAKIKKGAKAALKGQTGATGPAGPQGLQGTQGAKGGQGQTGPAGEAVAYATVADDGTLIAGKSSNVLQANIDTDTVAGTYCFTLPFPVKNAVVTPQLVFDGGQDDVIASVYVSQGTVSTGDCSGQLQVRTRDISDGALKDRAFTIWFED